MQFEARAAEGFECADIRDFSLLPKKEDRSSPHATIHRRRQTGLRSAVAGRFRTYILIPYDFETMVEGSKNG
jgi:hypothetical protein